MLKTINSLFSIAFYVATIILICWCIATGGVLLKRNMEKGLQEFATGLNQLTPTE